jgi:hypothetical protein
MSAWHDVLTGDAFRSWLLELTKSSKVPTGSRLDPFVTSLRRSGIIPAHLSSIDRGEPLAANDTAQAVTDLVQIGVVAKRVWLKK